KDGARQRTLIERFDDVIVDLQCAPRRIDEIGAAQCAVVFELAEEIEIEDAAGRGCRRKQADQDLGTAQERPEPNRRRKGLDAGKRLGRTAPARNLETDAVQQGSSAAAELAEPHDA